MASIQYFMDYVIFIQDASLYQFAVALAGGNLLKMAPRDAATALGIPFPYPSGNMSTIPLGIYFLFPYFPGSEFRFPGATGIFIDDAVLTKTVPGQAGSPASIWPAGPDGVFTWSANIIGSKGAGAGVTPPANAISQRRWICGHELEKSLEGLSGTTATSISRDSSRTIDGSGFVIRGDNITGALTRTLNQFRVGISTRFSWERFYIRVRRFPTANDVIVWRTHGIPSAAAGAALKVTVAGTIDAVNINSISQQFSKGTVFTPLLNVWYRIDILFKYGQGLAPPLGIVQHYVNGVFAQNWSDQVQGVAENNVHTNTELGHVAGPVDNEVEIDLDDWINSDLPANVDTVTMGFLDANFPIDWLLGSHVRLHQTISALQVNWLPAATAVGIENQATTPFSRSGTSELTSSTASATLEGLSDAVTQATQDSIANVLGAVAAIISIYSKNAGATDGTLGYKKAGGAAVLTTIDQTAAEGPNYAQYLPTGMIIPDEIAPWSTVHVKSADANTDTTYMMQSIVEYLGVWGPEDNPAFQFPISRIGFLHNCRYANTVWGYVGSQPAAPTYSIGGTYAGNGTYQEFTLPAACHFLFIRNITALGTPPVIFQAASFGAHLGTQDRVIPNVRLWFDAVNGLFKFSVVGGATSAVNINANNYQYIAFCDPGMRFCIASAFWHGAAASTPKANPLVASDFLAKVAFFQSDFPDQTSAANGYYLKGPANAANSGCSAQNGTTNANIANFALGVINSFSTLHQASTGVTNFLAFRTADSGADGCSSNVVVQVVQYTGNGAGTQVVPLTPASGRFPLFTLVWPGSGGGFAFFRDPSHAGASSCSLNDNTNSATGITVVGIDTITVGSSLNVNLVPYTIFVICGDSAGNNNGTFFSTYCDGDGPYIDPTVDTNSINVLGNGGLVLDGTTPITLLKDVSGIYTLVPGKTNDSLIDRQTGQTTVDVKIPDPIYKTGYIGG